VLEDQDRLGLAIASSRGSPIGRGGQLADDHLKLLQTQYDERSQHDPGERAEIPAHRPQSAHPETTRGPARSRPKDHRHRCGPVAADCGCALDRAPRSSQSNAGTAFASAAQARLGICLWRSRQERLFLIETIARR